MRNSPSNSISWCFVLAALIVNSTSTISQNVVPDSATVILRNIGKIEFVEIIGAIEGQMVGAAHLKPGDEVAWRLACGLNGPSRFTVYTNEELTEKYSIEPIDYVSQVGNRKLYPGAFKYLIDISESEQVLQVRMIQLE